MPLGRVLIRQFSLYLLKLSSIKISVLNFVFENTIRFFSKDFINISDKSFLIEVNLIYFLDIF